MLCLTLFFSASISLTNNSTSDRSVACGACYVSNLVCEFMAPRSAPGLVRRTVSMCRFKSCIRQGHGTKRFELVLVLSLLSISSRTGIFAAADMLPSEARRAPRRIALILAGVLNLGFGHLQVRSCLLPPRSGEPHSCAISIVVVVTVTGNLKRLV